MNTKIPRHTAPIFLLLLLNPVFYTLIFGVTSGGMLPDSPLYIKLGNAIVGRMMLYLPGYEHIDTAFILPPLYPLLIGIANLFRNDGILNSQLISSIGIIFASIPLYIYAAKKTNRVTAFLAVATIQINAIYLLYGTTSLTEGIFFSICAWNIYAIDRYTTDRSGISHPASIATLSAAAVLTRQIGIFTFPLFILVVVAGRKQGTIDKAAARRDIATFACIFSAICAVYAIPLYIQTSHTPLTQSFRLDKYIVRSTESVPSATPENPYAEMYAIRRQARRLLHSGSEMQSYAVAPLKSSASAITTQIAKNFPISFVANLNNVTHASGKWLAITFLILATGSIYSVIYKNSQISRLLIPAAVIIYIVILSFITGAIERYVEILYPLLVLHVFIELTLIVRSTGVFKRIQQIFPAIVTLLILAGTPRLFFSSTFSPKMGETNTPISHCKRFIQPDEPIFSLTTLEPYLLGGYRRILPNDELDKIAQYAGKTGVRWLLVRWSPVASQEASFYDNAPWLQRREDPEKLNRSFKLVCESEEHDAKLYSIN